MFNAERLRKILSSQKALFKEVGCIYKYAAGLLKKYRKDLSFVLLLKSFSFPLGLSLVYITKITLDKGIIDRDLGLFLGLTALGLIVFILTRSLVYFSGKKIQKVKTCFSRDANYDMTRRLFGLNYHKIKKMSSAENSFVLNYDYHVIENLVFYVMPSFVSVFKIPVLFILASFISLPLVSLALLSLPFIAFYAFLASGVRKRLKTKEMDSSRRYHSRLHDILLNIKLIKSLNKEEWALGSAISLFGDKTESSLKSSLFGHKLRFVSDIFLKVNTIFFGILGGYLIITGRLSLGSFSAVSMYALLMVTEMYNLSDVFQEFNEERVSIARNASFIREISEEGSGPPVVHDIVETEKNRDIVFDDISFGYADNNILFRNLSLNVPAGKWTLIKGVSGAGKTTLLGLFLRLYDPKAGSIYLGKNKIDHIDKKSFFGNISVVHQEPHLFNDTLMSNILLGEERNIADTKKALICARVDELADGMDFGYNSRVGEAGLSLSGGQKQRIAIARALARDPGILILDEATSSLDIAAEEEIFCNIKKLYPDLTVIFVTHRDSAEKFADEVHVMKEGKMLRKHYRINEEG